MGVTESLEKIREWDVRATPDSQQTYRLALLLSDNSPEWFRELCAHIHARENGMTVIKAANLLQAIDTPDIPDAIIGCGEHDTLALFATLEAVSDEPHRPIRVLLCDPEDEINDDDRVDIFLPASTQSFFTPLRTCLRLRAKALQQARHAEMLEVDLKQEQQKRQEQERIASEVSLLKETIVRNVSHELRTPLLHLKSAVALMVEDHPNDTLSHYATEATARIESVVTNIALLASSLDIELAPVIVREVIDQSIRYLRRSWQHKENVARVEMHIDEQLPLVLGDKQGLVTVLQLLIDNALKFSEKSVIVSACRVERGVRVSIKDFGIGIPPDELDKIFDSFYQVDSSSTRRFGGTGVGLAIVRLILEKHGVEIQVESEPSCGSTFTFVLPLIEIPGHTGA